MLHCWFCLPNFKLLFSQKGMFAEFFYPLIRNIRRIQFPECGARLNNFYLSKLLCIFPSLFAKNLNKARYNISYQFLALKDPVLRRNKATNSSTSICPFFSCTESHIVLGNLFKVYRLDITFAREVCHLGKKKIWQSSYSFHYPQWQNARANVMANLFNLNKLPNTRVFVAAENGSVDVLELVPLFLLKTETCDAKNFWEFFLDNIICLVKIGFEKRGTNTK